MLNNENTFVKKSEKIGRDKNNKNSLIRIERNTINNYTSPELQEEIKILNKKVSEMEEVIFLLKDNVKTISHFDDLNDFAKIYSLSNNEIYKICQDNKILEKVIETQVERERRNIIDNVRFLKESNHEEKTALIWMWFCRILSYNLQNIENLKSEVYKNIKKKYPFIKPFVDFGESLALFNKFGIFKQGTMFDAFFSKKHFEIENFNIELDKVYSEFPEVKAIYESAQRDSNKGFEGIELKSLMVNHDRLHYAINWLLKDIGIEINN